MAWVSVNDYILITTTASRATWTVFDYGHPLFLRPATRYDLERWSLEGTPQNYDLDRYLIDPPTNTGIVFRVVAAGLNYASCVARNPEQIPTLGNAWDHLAHQRLPDPWISVTIKWRKALRRAQRFHREGALEIYIYVIDLRRVRKVIDASTLGRRFDMDEYQHKDEILLCESQASENIIAILPANGGDTGEVITGADSVKIPKSVADEAGEGNEEQVRRWFEDEIYYRKGIRSSEMTGRVLESMRWSIADVSKLPWC